MTLPAQPSRDETGDGWAPGRIGDLTGLTAIVTGANSGLGLQTSTQLAKAGAHVVLACRDQGRAKTAAGQIRSAAPEADLELLPLDLSRQASVRAFADGWDGRRLDLLVNNAGVMAPPRQVTEDGFELQLATNHLGHFALTGLLLPALLGTGARARVVGLSSTFHWMGWLRRDDLMWQRHYLAWGAYAQSKLADLLFMTEFERRIGAAGREDELIAVAAHPGYAATNLQTSGPRLLGLPVLRPAVEAVNKVVGQPAAHGAWPVLRAATDPAAQGGDYYGPGGFAELRGYPRRVGMSGAARDPEQARWLWERSAELTGVDYAGLDA